MSTEEKGIEKLIKRLPNKSRFRFFFLFLFISFSFWTSTKLSKEYQLVQPFFVKWKEIPKGVILKSESVEINLTINASGIEILWYRLFNKELEVSLGELDFSFSDTVLNFEDQYFNIQQQLLNSSKLIQISPTLFPIQYSKMDSKWISIDPQINIQFRHGYLGEQEIKVIPDSVLVRGSQAILDTLRTIKTLEFNVSDVHQTIDQKIELQSLIGLQYDYNQTDLYWPVLQYSEKTLKIPIEVIHLPIGDKVKLFPPEATVRVTLPLLLVNSINPIDFSLAIDYNDILDGEPPELELKLQKQPLSVKKIIWMPKTVNYLIRR